MSWFPCSERTGIDELAPLLGKEGREGGCCKESVGTAHWFFAGARRRQLRCRTPRRLRRSSRLRSRFPNSGSITRSTDPATGRSGKPLRWFPVLFIPSRAV